MRSCLIFVFLVLVLMTAGCATTKQEVTTPPPTTLTIVATPTPEPTITRPLPGMDPIIGSWDNGMVFNADGSVGSDGTTTWKANDMLKNSYFVTTQTPGVFDAAGGRRIGPTITSTELIYNPGSDTLHIRDSSTGIRRVLSVKATAVPAVT